MKTYKYTYETLSPEKAWRFVYDTARDPEVVVDGLHIQTNEDAFAILYHAAVAKGIRIYGTYRDGKKIEIDERIKNMRKNEWFAYVHESNRKSSKPNGSQQTNGKDDFDIPALAELNVLTGLVEVKQQVGDMAAFFKVMRARESVGLKITRMGQHLVFTGNPGTGKTTVARLVGQIYRDLGVIRRGHFIEISGRDLIGEYIGQTAPKVDEAVKEALDGILFIDEAYALAPQDRQDSYSAEAVTKLLTHMENYRERLVVIVAGYDQEMERLLNSNPGLKTRFKTKIDFPDYGPDELVTIFEHICKKESYNLTCEAKHKMVRLCDDLHRYKGENFGNGRTVRNAFDKAVINQARRLSGIGKKPNKEALQSLQPVDIPDINDIEW
ncbi:MAG: hypothetical protein CME59_16105 [Halioglobus sp.]|nr:hypothetical protein [Halioglobus sp.]|tara:strand:- start:10585 stop:11730 length:1146 start_codon:yes stop_codon:yes gene_type:complete